ncbi:hypothetical protein [Ruminococcus sp.]|uniref:hypothetical protein n=1 Tax=Ruminococcus sp. TaxID=41978 RepID=UPI001B40FD2E|nr:hypothetical protein [Ruminococcus sp.]MBP5580605.1 hypothetical protein [Ruminococcus sp.]MCR4639932.1 hypothetical protein [Ruminococcus sp.]
MKKQFFCICAAAVLTVCGASCGSRPASKNGITVSVETVNNVPIKDIIANTTGKWETTKEYLNGRERSNSDMTYNCYDLAADGSGICYTPDGNKQQVSWEVTSDGGVRILYEEMGELTEYYDFLGCDLVTKKQTDEGTLDIYLAKVTKFSGKGAET